MAQRPVAFAAALLLLAASALAPLPVAAQEWQAELTEQILREKDCEVSFFSHVTEREVGGDLVILAKVHCVDKRSFDAYRDSAFEPFEIKLCEKPKATSC